jgi:serine/threonine protein kinase
VVQSPRDHVELPKLHKSQYVSSFHYLSLLHPAISIPGFGVIANASVRTAIISYTSVTRSILISWLIPTVDVWSVGCILAELLGGKPFFKGRDYVDQLNQILHYLGTPNEETLSRIGSPRAQDYVRNLPYMQKVSFASLFRQANPDALDLLDRMLAFDPSSRISVEEALEHRYLHIWHDASDEPACPTTFNFEFEVVEEIPDMKKMILDEVKRFRHEVRMQPGAGGQGQQQQQQQAPVPIPNNYDRTGYEDPRPQETMMQGGWQGNDLERDLQGLDARGMR